MLRPYLRAALPFARLFERVQIRARGTPSDTSVFIRVKEGENEGEKSVWAGRKTNRWDYRVSFSQLEVFPIRSTEVYARGGFKVDADNADARSRSPYRGLPSTSRPARASPSSNGNSSVRSIAIVHSMFDHRKSNENGRPRLENPRSSVLFIIKPNIVLRIIFFFIYYFVF